jgi:Ca2+-binding RTX toxin-like protein
MFEGTSVKLQIFTPSLDDPSSRPVTAKVRDPGAEFNDVSFYDLDGDPYFVVAAKFDVSGYTLKYRIVETFGGYFVNVDDETGFNGYALTFASLKSNDRIALRDARLSRNELDVDPSDVFVDRDTLFIDVDGLRYDSGNRLQIELGFRFTGTRGDNRLVGGDGRDALVGGVGADLLRGKGGADRFVVEKARDSTPGASGRDTILDFAGNDRIDLSDLPGRLRFLGDDRFDGDPKALRAVARKDSTLVQADLDGDRRADLAILLDDGVTLHRDDFIL